MKSKFIKSLFEKISSLPNRHKAETMINAFIVIFGKDSLSKCSFSPIIKNKKILKTKRSRLFPIRSKYSQINEFIDSILTHEYAGYLELVFTDRELSLETNGFYYPIEGTICLYIGANNQLHSARLEIHNDNHIENIEFNKDSNIDKNLLRNMVEISPLSKKDVAKFHEDVNGIISKLKNNEDVIDHELDMLFALLCNASGNSYYFIADSENDRDRHNRALRKYIKQ